MTGTSSSKRKPGNAGHQSHQFSRLRIESSYRSKAGAIKSSFTRVFIVYYGSSAYSPSPLRTGVRSKSSPMTLGNIAWGWHTPVKYYRTFGMRLLHSDFALLAINLLNDIVWWRGCRQIYYSIYLYKLFLIFLLLFSVQKLEYKLQVALSKHI